MDSRLAAINPLLIAPFALLLALIALAPLFFADFWAKHYSKVVGGLAALVVLYYIFGLHATGRVLETAHDYASFIILIGSLFIVSGGIHINVKGEATPFANVLFLLTGAILANVLGTTGASMLLIRPWLRMNKYRVTGHHVVFFIFLVSNVGGCLTPLGPPLFLGYLAGVPFFWVMAKCFPMWATAVAILLVMFFIVDSRNFRRASRVVREEEIAHGQWKFQGLANVFFLTVVLGAVFINHPLFVREALMAAAALGSYFTTSKTIHETNHFTFHPIKEVAILFIGIFATMMPALDWLQSNSSRFQTATPGMFYWGSGLLSSVLDNAPTYLCFLNAMGGPKLSIYLAALSVGSVFFGGCTYIGNGPNFMVKAIADHQKVHTPSFPGYIAKYTLPFMLPTLLLVWLIFFFQNR